MTNSPDKNTDDGGFWAGLLVGGILGTVTGLFLGGDDKNKLKKKLKDTAFNWWENIGDFTESVKEKAIDLKDETAEEAEEARQKTQEAVLIAQKKIEAIANSAQQAVNEQVAEVTKTVGNNSGSLRKKFFFHKGRSLQKQANL